jgi:hypothetical protein
MKALNVVIWVVELLFWESRLGGLSDGHGASILSNVR